MILPCDAPALLTMPHYAGTLAAARCLARSGVDVVIASDRLLAPASWSRHVTDRVQSPPVSDGPQALFAWLLRYGQRHPGTVLHPTSDDIAYVIARYAGPLRQYFHLYVPPLSVVCSVLDKSALYRTCIRLGVPTPRTWFPRSEQDAVRVASSGRALLLKPRAQMFFPGGGKGETVTGPEDARAAWRSYRSNRYIAEILEDIPDLELPMLQEYEASGTQGTYSVSGFADAAGNILGARASTKVLQTARSGTGLYFVASELDPIALRSIQVVCRSIGYFGTFEVEFVRRGDVPLLIDFNPRYYGQMGFEIARGATFPWLMHCAALGQTERLDAFAAETPPRDGPLVYRDQVAMMLWLGRALASGAATWRELLELQRMTEEHSSLRVDASWHTADPLPSIVAAAAVAWDTVRHPLSFLRSLQKSREIRQQPVPPTS